MHTEIHQHLTRSLRVSLRIRFSFSLIPKDLFTRKIIKHIFVHFQPSKKDPLKKKHIKVLRSLSEQKFKIMENNFFFRCCSVITGGFDVCEMMLSRQDAESRSDYVPWMENPCKLDCKSAPYASSWPLILILSVQVGPTHGSWHALDSTTATSSLACVNERSGGCRRVSCTPETHRRTGRKARGWAIWPCWECLFTCRGSGSGGAACTPLGWCCMCVS